MNRIQLSAMHRRVLIALVIFAAVVSATYPAYLASMRAKSLEQRLSRFDALLSALKSYDDNIRRLPLAVSYDESGAALYSWRVSLVPYLEGVKDLLDLGSSWKAPSNRYFAEQEVPLYCNAFERDANERIKGVVSAIVGHDTPMQLRSSSRLAEVPRDTILLIEAKPHSVHWMAPGDVSLGADEMDVLHNDGKGFVVGFADGEIWYLHHSVPIDELMKFATVSPDNSRDREATLGPFKISSRRARYFHEY